VIDELDDRLVRGPLRVQSVWSPGSADRVERLLLRRRRAVFATRVALTCACVLFVPFLFGPLAGDSPGALDAPLVRSFVDGSLAELTSRDATLSVAEDTAERVVSRLSGGARFRVVPNPRRTFEVRAGEVRVRVLGTTFSVQEVPSGRTQVLVEEGRVEVAWLGGATLLTAGQGGAFPPPPVSAPSAEPPPAPSNERGAARREGQLNPGAAPARDDPASLLEAADAARLRNRPGEAIAPLQALLRRYPRDRRAPVAAFTLGRVLLDDLDRPLEAARAFAKAQALWAGGPLADDALAREVEACRRSGQLKRARALAERYLARHPEGKHVAAMRELLAR
jgi:transmembrane sensor